MQIDLASATAEMVDSEIKLAYERESALSNVESNVTLVKSAQIKLDAANKRSTLANETRQFFDKSFRYGETDLPTRLRIELEAVDANKTSGDCQNQLRHFCFKFKAGAWPATRVKA